MARFLPGSYLLEFTIPFRPPPSQVPLAPFQFIRAVPMAINLFGRFATKFIFNARETVLRSEVYSTGLRHEETLQPVCNQLSSEAT